MNEPTQSQDRITEFNSKLKKLIAEYDVELRACIGYYGEDEGIDIFCGEKLAAHFYWGYGTPEWKFGDGDPTTLSALKADTSKP